MNLSSAFGDGTVLLMTARKPTGLRPRLGPNFCCFQLPDSERDDKNERNPLKPPLGPPLSSYNRAMQKRQDTKGQIAPGQAALRTNVRLTLNIDDSINRHISSQPGALRTIIMNLLGNSLKYTEESSISMSLERDKSRLEPEDSHIHAVIIVSDTGKGVSEDFVNNHAFTAFCQENSLSSRTGLGLSVIRQIIDGLGGEIDMQSQKSVGTEVEIWLSLQISHTKPETTILNQVQEGIGRFMMRLLGPRGDYTPNHESESLTPRMGLGITSSVHNFLRNLTSRWFSIYVFTAPSMENVTADLFVYTEPPPIDHPLQLSYYVTPFIAIKRAS